MSQPDNTATTNTKTTNDKTTAAATDENALPLSGTTLIGTLTGPNGPVALLRLRRGDIRRVSKGDKIDGARITAISDGQLHLSRAGQPEILTMPRS